MRGFLNSNFAFFCDRLLSFAQIHQPDRLSDTFQTEPHSHPRRFCLSRQRKIFLKNARIRVQKRANQNHAYFHNGKRLRHKIELDNTIAFPFIKISFNTFFSVFLKSLGQLFIQEIQSYGAKKGQMCGNL